MLLAFLVDCAAMTPCHIWRSQWLLCSCTAFGESLRHRQVGLPLLFLQEGSQQQKRPPSGWPRRFPLQRSRSCRSSLPPAASLCCCLPPAEPPPQSLHPQWPPATLPAGAPQTSGHDRFVTHALQQLSSSRQDSKYQMRDMEQLVLVQHPHDYSLLHNMLFCSSSVLLRPQITR